MSTETPAPSQEPFGGSSPWGRGVRNRPHPREEREEAEEGREEEQEEEGAQES